MFVKNLLPNQLVLAGFLMLTVACDAARPTGPLPPTTSQPLRPPSAAPTFTAATRPEEMPLETATHPSTLSANAALTSTATVKEGGDVATATGQPPSSPILTLSVSPTQPATLPPSPAPIAFPPTIALEPVFSGFQSPIYVTHASREVPWLLRLFIVEKRGHIYMVDNGLVQTAPFLDITDRVGSQGSEQGLLSVAFPPDFAISSLFYVNYTDQNGDTVVARYRLLESAPEQADPTSEQEILRISQPAGNHNGGQLQFGPDGYLYIGMGDGGQAGDPWGNAQNPGTLLGKMLRVNVTGTETYTVPGDNPSLGWPNALPEIWALGLRNPWRFAFDRATGDLYIADVGQNAYEEVNFQSAYGPGGENYGWDLMEGNHCFEPAINCNPGNLVLPVAEYDHSQGCSITGGYVYRGDRYPQLVGVYLLGDFCSGNIWGLRKEVSGEWAMALLLKTNVNISSFGEDATGEIYAVGYSDGTIYHLVALP